MWPGQHEYEPINFNEYTRDYGANVEDKDSGDGGRSGNADGYSGTIWDDSAGSHHVLGGPDYPDRDIALKKQWCRPFERSSGIQTEGKKTVKRLPKTICFLKLRPRSIGLLVVLIQNNILR